MKQTPSGVITSLPGMRSLWRVPCRTSNAGSPSDIPNRVPSDFAIVQRAIFYIVQ